MQKRILIFSLSILLLFFASRAVNAFSSAKVFAGKIIKTKAIQIESLENAGYRCIVVGETIQIIPRGGNFPTSYFIPASVTSQTKNTNETNHLILGLYSGVKTSITCQKTYYPWDSQTVQLDTIQYYGTSQGVAK